MSATHILLLLFLVIFSGDNMSWADDTFPFESQCGYTRFPKLCAEALSTAKLAPETQFVDLVSALVKRTISESNLPASNFEAQSYHFISKELAQNTRNAIGECRELLNMSIKQFNQSLEAIQQSPEKNKADIQTWLSAALTYQQICKDTADAYAASNPYMAEISNKMDYLSQLSSNPLALVNRITPKPEKTNASIVQGRRLTEEQDHFPRWVSARDRKLLQSGTIQANVVVAKDGTGNFETVSEAIQAAGGGRFVIYVKAGYYNEKIHCNKEGITLIGDGKYSTIIAAWSSVGGGSSLQGSATVTITGDRFIAKDIGFQNNAGPGGEQAVALLIASDRAVLYRCGLAGYQDTLYALSLRQFYRECDISGTIDFIFGNAAAVFQNCNLVLRRPIHGAYNVILANGRTDPGQNTGFSLQNCIITVDSDFLPVKNNVDSFLGRPWRAYSTAVVMQSTIDGAISSRGWVEWPGAPSYYYQALYFAEFGNMGPGAGTGGRVRWPGFRVMSSDEASQFTVANFIAGTSWLPSTGVEFISGLS